MNYQTALTPKSTNTKTGPIPVSTTSAITCPDACPLKDSGCYAKTGRTRIFWDKVTEARARVLWRKFLESVAALADGTLWRHNQAGDLPGQGDVLDYDALEQLVKANAGKRGFTYTHKPMTRANQRAIRKANENGFTINLSGNNLQHADMLAMLDCGPVVVVLDKPEGGRYDLTTPMGRRVVTCPATYRDDVTCQSCQLCQRQRSCIVGFPAHGQQHKAAAAIARGVS